MEKTDKSIKGSALAAKDPLAAGWKERVERMREFKPHFGHCLVPQQYSNNTGIEPWVTTQRHNYKLYSEGKPSCMTAEHIRELESVEVVCDTSAALWTERFRELCEFKAHFGHCRVPREYSSNPKLGKWVTNQRQNYKLYWEGKPSGMTEQRIQELERVEFVWDTSAALWSLRFRELCEFKAQFGHCLLPLRYSSNLMLGRWAAKQRHDYKLYSEGKQSGTTVQRIRELDSIEFVWDPLAADWKLRFRQLCEFKAQFGHCLLPFRYSSNPKLGRWVAKQRHDYKLYSEGKQSGMTEQRMRELESIEFAWDPLADSWSIRFRQLCAWKAQFGHCLVSPEYPKLGKWVTRQRHDYNLYSEGKPSGMTAERIRELDSIEFVWDPHAAVWKLRFRQLREFKAQFVHSLVPPEYSKLGPWVTTQRQKYKLHSEGKPSCMTVERIRELESVEFVWDP